MSEEKTVMASDAGIKSLRRMVFVRHPMYLGVIIFYIFSPLALGSYWAIIPALLMIPLLMARTVSEERELSKNLEGYIEYTKKTRYRLIPGIW
jgi:protein-S-isoprenylcysteine O-methyltransferase Ste14